MRGAIFDMDGTLVDSLMFWDRLWQRLGERYMGDAAFRPDDTVEKAVRTMIFADAMRYFHRYYHLACAPSDFVAFAEGGIRAFYREVATVKPGAFALLDGLRARGVRLALASATAKDVLLDVLSNYGLAPYFDTVLSCAEIGVGKERPDIYLRAACEMGLSPADCFVVEDSYVALETARDAGFRTVGIYDRYNPGQDRVEAASGIYLGPGRPLSELIPLLFSA